MISVLFFYKLKYKIFYRKEARNKTHYVLCSRRERIGDSISDSAVENEPSSNAQVIFSITGHSETVDNGAQRGLSTGI